MRTFVARGALVVDIGTRYRCLSSAVYGGGMGSVRTWMNVQVPADYARVDPDAHIKERAVGLPPPVVGMLTAADVAGHVERSSGGATAVATVGLGHPLAAAGTRPASAPRFGTINMLVVSALPLSDEGLVGALQTAVEAKAQALAEARIFAVNANAFATGTATDSICLACPEGEGARFAGPATCIGGEIARAVHAAVLYGARADVVAGDMTRASRP